MYQKVWMKTSWMELPALTVFFFVFFFSLWMWIKKSMSLVFNAFLTILRLVGICYENSICRWLDNFPYTWVICGNGTRHRTLTDVQKCWFHQHNFDWLIDRRTFYCTLSECLVSADSRLTDSLITITEFI